MKDKTDHTFRFLSLAVLGLIIVGTTFYHFVESLSWIDAYYFSVITLTTVGYGDFSPVTNIGKVFTTLYLLMGMGIVVGFVNYAGKRGLERREKRMEKRAAKKNKDSGMLHLSGSKEKKN